MGEGEEEKTEELHKQNDEKANESGVLALRVRWWVWVILVAALFAVSSAATALKAINAPPLLKASWRLQATSILLAVGFSYQLIKLWYNTDPNSTDYSPEIKKRYFTIKTFGILGLSGASLAVHFGTWVVSLNFTSLPHSLLFVTCHPILIVFGSLLLKMPISRGEIIGSVGGFVGLILTLLDSFLSSSNGSDPAGVFGDFLAFVGALAIIVYLYVGKNLRSWVVLYLYAFPVTFLSAVLLLIASLILESDALSYGVVGWFSSEYILLVAYLAIGPGFVGHTGINAILKYVEPVVISVTLLIEPVIGSFIGYFFKQSSLPGLFTFLGGPIIIAGCAVVTVSAYKRTKTQTTTTAAVEMRQTTNENVLSDESKTNTEQRGAKQTTKYEKLQEEQDDIELDVVVDNTLDENKE